MSSAIIQAPFVATPKQNDAAAAWQSTDVRVLLLDGAIRSGKTQCGGRLFFETAMRQPSTYLVARSTYRSLKDSTQKAMLHGDGPLPPLVPPQAVERYWASDERVVLRNGAEILFRSLEEGQIGKLLNLTLGGILVDQIEEIDDGTNGERLFDTLMGRLSDPRGPRKLLAIANPKGVTSWQFRRLVNASTRDAGVERVHFTLRDNAQNLPADYVASMEATRETRPHWYRAFIDGEWGSFEGQAFEEFSERAHVVEPFQIPDNWERFESMDHGASNPTAWLAWASDHDGNHVVYDAYYSPGLVSKHAAEVLSRRVPLRDGDRRLNSWTGERDWYAVWADPSISASHGLSNRQGEPASVRTEYGEYGIGLAAANNDRRAGYMRLLELLHPEPGRLPPPWSRLAKDAPSAPRLYVFSHVTDLIDQFKSAPIAAEGLDAGECVDPKWSNSHGHALDACRYGAMSRPRPTPVPDFGRLPDDPRHAFWVERNRRDAGDPWLDEDDMQWLRTV